MARARLVERWRVSKRRSAEESAYGFLYIRAKDVLRVPAMWFRRRIRAGHHLLSIALVRRMEGGGE